MGGSSPSVDTSFLGAQPQQGRPLNFNRILQQGQQAGDQLMGQQMNYISGVQTNLASSPYLQEAQNAARGATGITREMKGAQDSLTGLGGQYSALATKSIQESDPTSIERELYRQGEADLALGRSLSPEQQRQAEQQARSAMQARGLATSNAGVAAELLNRDAYGQQREDSRRNFAASANNLMSDNLIKRRTAASQYGATAGGLLGQAGSLAGQRYGLGLDYARTMQSMDPYANAYSLGGGLASGAAMGGLDYAGNIASFNTNRQDSLYNSWMNNSASLNAANMQSSAAGNAGTMGLLGSLGQGLIGAGSMALAGPTGGLSLLAAPAAGAAFNGFTAQKGGQDSWFGGY
jgi:hypothetical protein